MRPVSKLAAPFADRLRLAGVPENLGLCSCVTGIWAASSAAAALRLRRRCLRLPPLALTLLLPLVSHPVQAQDVAGPDIDAPLPARPTFSREALVDMLDQARGLVGQQRYPEAITAMKLYLEKAPDDDQVRLELARVYSWTQQYEPALQLYRELLHSVPDDAELLLERARIQLWAGQHREAASALTTLHTTLVVRAEAPVLPVGAGDAEASPALAIRGPDALLDRVERALADALAWSGDLERAIPFYERLFALNPYDTTLGQAYARALSQKRDYAKAIQIFDTLLGLGVTEPAFLLDRGKVLLWGERYAEGLGALTGLRQSLRQSRQHGKELEPAFQDELDRTIAAGYAWAHDFPAAAREYNALVQKYPEEPSLRLELARVLRELNLLDAFLAQYDRYLELRPRDFAVGLERARSLVWAERYPEAIRAYLALRTTLSSPVPDLPESERKRFLEEAERMLVRSYLWSGQPAKALPHLQALVTLNPEDAQLAAEVARTLAQADRLEEARATWDRYRALGGDSAIADLGEAQTWLWEEDELRARAALKRVMAVNPNLDGVSTLEAELAPRLRTPITASLENRVDSAGFARIGLPVSFMRPHQTVWAGGDFALDTFVLPGGSTLRASLATQLRYRHTKELSALVKTGFQLATQAKAPVSPLVVLEAQYAPVKTTSVAVRLSTSEAVDSLFTAAALEERMRMLEFTLTASSGDELGWQLWGQARASGYRTPDVMCTAGELCSNGSLSFQALADWREPFDKPFPLVLRVGSSIGLLHYALPEPLFYYWSPDLYASAGARAGIETRLFDSIPVEARLRLALAYASDVGGAFPEVNCELFASQPLTERLTWRFETGYGRTVRMQGADSAAAGEDVSPAYWSARVAFQVLYKF